ncbi:hypothetical protein MtrunA17_Chr1g0162131 [Medicago truncatula]|uniref:Uncharacterized protein n=1 Tax=Medicago truncatula TaxID=3880 RepID=A0A396JIR0_MEDTR|nr:hypothetical protein MtrunA17_Chr1g0162131 [Medicago truncatula]
MNYNIVKYFGITLSKIILFCKNAPNKIFYIVFCCVINIHALRKDK